MTSKLTRERIELIANFHRAMALPPSHAEIEELARMALAAMDSEPITVTDDMAYAFHHALTDSMIGADDVEEIKTGLRAVFANLTAPVVSAEYPDRLPCSVLLEPGLRFGKGIKTSTMLAALARRAVHESDMAALSPEERAEFQARIEDFKALIAQPAPVVPAVSDDIGEIRVGRLPTMNQDDYPGLGDWWVQLRIGEDSDEVLARVYGATPQEANNRAEALACRAAMLAAAPQLFGSEPATVLGSWIPVSERMPENDGVYLCWDNRYVTTYAFIFGAWQANQFIAKNITHWMPLPNPPRRR
ncbi:DUF551 domain-containing protein [Klebsiella quasipneumoniae]|nr:DUF551 domain-containing protein [Klebsiella quasipneumoniae]MDX7608983.1 DUF551 domain-containing protein [Klebsiella quasipneumoniae]